MAEDLFDQLARDLAQGGSRRQFVRRSSGLAAMAVMARAGLPARWANPVATLFGVASFCKSDADCGDPCLECAIRAAGEVKSCIPKCQASCSRCSAGRCIDLCPGCEFCYPGMSHPGASCQPVEILRQCIECDRKTGKRTTLCSACEKCEQGQCVSNCPGRCEICDNGTCRPCGGSPCESCDEATGECSGCNSACERCNAATQTCETACPGGLACCEGRCVECCGSCSRCLDPSALGPDFCPAVPAGEAKELRCCSTGCKNVKTDDRNCGSCDHGCYTASELCEDGRCRCRSKLESIDGRVVRRGGGMECRRPNHECCDGNCVDTASYQSDPEHCGKCIVKCEKDEKCVKGECVGVDRLAIRYRYQGYKFIESAPEDCPRMRPDGQELLTARLRLISADSEGSVYEGPGQLTVDIDGCGLTPNRNDPGQVHDRGDVPGEFHGDNFLGCMVTTVVPEHAGRVRVEVAMDEDRRPDSIRIRWLPAGAPAVKVSSDCEKAYHATYAKTIPDDYRRGYQIEITSYDLLPRIAPGGKLRPGTYSDPDGTSEGRWVFAVGDRE